MVISAKFSHTYQVTKSLGSGEQSPVLFFKQFPTHCLPAFQTPEKMHLLPLLLLLAGARVEGEQGADGFEELKVAQQKREIQQEKNYLQEKNIQLENFLEKNYLHGRQLLKQDKMKDTNCSQLLDSFSESSSNFTRCPRLFIF